VNAVTIGRAFPGVRNNNFEQKLEYLGTVRARLGYAWDRTLVYGTGGLAYGGVNRQPSSARCQRTSCSSRVVKRAPKWATPSVAASSRRSGKT
jgi:opacity protein-like surface antigen